MYKEKRHPKMTLTQSQFSSNVTHDGGKKGILKGRSRNK